MPTFDGAVMERGGIATDGMTANADSHCDTISATPNPLPPDILILLDRSGSMNNDINDKSCNGACPAPGSKWTQMTAAINTAVASSQATVRWGLKFFGSGGNGSCANAAGAAVAPGLNNAAAIMTAIARQTPGSATPTAVAEKSASDYLGTVTDQNPKFILLATDGEPNCAGNPPSDQNTDDPGAIAAVGAAATAGYETFVVGIATTGMGTADMTLSSMATAGGVPQAGSPAYYPVASTADLVTAIGKIQAQAKLTCTYDIGGMPSDVNGVGVSINGTTIAQGPDGWMYGPNDRTVVLVGATCAAIMAGTVTSVQIFLPCGTYIIP